MKKILLLFVLTFIISGYATAQGLSYGVKGGLNFATINSGDFDVDSKSGFHAGVFGNISIIILQIQPEILFSQKGFSYKPASDQEVDVRLNYIDIPVMARIKFFPALTLDLGPQYSVLVSQKTETTVTLANGDKETSSSSSTSDMNTSELGGAVGLTATFWKVGASARYTFGFSDVMKDKDDGDGKNRVFQLSAFVKF
jgi:hypothetical protein